MKKKKKTAKAKKTVKKTAKKKTAKKIVKKAKTRKAGKRSGAAKGRAKKAKKTQPSTRAAQIMAPPNSVHLGRVEDYFAHIGVIALTLETSLSVGNRIQVLGHTTHFEQTVDSMQIEHQPVSQAGEKAGVGIKVINRARAGDHVYRLL
jgi:hypothetical protein